MKYIWNLDLKFLLSIIVSFERLSYRANTSERGLNMTKDAEVDFNVFVGAETGILKGVNVHSKGNIVKNFHNLQHLDKQFEITCASFGSGEGEILMGLRNQSVKVN